MFIEIKVTLGSYLAHHRRVAELTKINLSKEAKVCVKSIGDWESNRKIPHPKVVARLVKALPTMIREELCILYGESYQRRVAKALEGK